MTKDSLLMRSGDAFLPKNVIEFLNIYIFGDDKSLLYLNLWSLVHFSSGMIAAFILKTNYDAFLVHIIWELWQIFIGMTIINTRGIIDIIIDTLMFMIGFIIVNRITQPPNL